jgi:hypothetical protein
VTPLDAALDYAELRGWPMFPCHWADERRKRPLTTHGLHSASHDAEVITAWWRRWPRALVALPTGRAIGAAVLDIDIKDDRANGFDSLDALGCTILPETPMAHTASGGLHLYLSLPDGIDLRNTAGGRGAGIGPGLDWRGDGGYVIAPSPGSGYEWDPHWNLDTVSLAPVPGALLPRQLERSTIVRPVRSTSGLSPYAEVVLDGACRRIITAPNGQQEATLNSESFAIGALAAAGAVPPDFARRVLLWGAVQMPNYDLRRPWPISVIEAKVDRAFGDGLRRARKAYRA